MSYRIYLVIESPSENHVLVGAEGALRVGDKIIKWGNLRLATDRKYGTPVDTFCWSDPDSDTIGLSKTEGDNWVPMTLNDVKQARRERVLRSAGVPSDAG